MVGSGYQPSPGRLSDDAEPAISGKFFMYQQPNDPIRGTIPDGTTRESDYGIYTPSLTASYTVRDDLPRGIVGRAITIRKGAHHGRLANFCCSALQISPAANRINAGMGGIHIFSDATIMATNTLACEILNNVGRKCGTARACCRSRRSPGVARRQLAPRNIGPFGFCPRHADVEHQQRHEAARRPRSSSGTTTSTATSAGAQATSWGISAS
jgi:hypothetical protein